MRQRLGQSVRPGLAILIVTMMFLAPVASRAAPYAAMVIDARSGEVLHSRNADTRLHPASLTKMMTLYIAFEAVERGEISLDQKVTISRFAASEPPSKLGLKAGQRIALRYLIRAAAVKSGNDAATAIAEAIEGSEAAFARRMNRTAKALGMTRTTFKNAHGLTEAGHLSTARDMTTLGRHLFYDYPEYYNLFSRRATHAGVREVYNTNRKLLQAYRGADGIKTGYTRAAGFNLVASAERDGERIIATMFGGTSSAARNRRVAELLDMGFARAPRHVAVVKPPRPTYGRTVVARSLRPAPNPRRAADVLLAAADPIEAAVGEVLTDTPPPEVVDAVAAALDAEGVPTAAIPEGGMALAAPAGPAPRPRPAIEVAERKATQQIVTRISTSGGRHWGVTIGRFGSRYQAERALLQTALAEIGTLDEALRKVVRTPAGFDANFVGLSQEGAALACRRLVARARECQPFGPG